MKTVTAKFASLLCMAVLAAMTTGCDEPGPFERAGEEVDEAVNTLKNGKESTADKLDDAVDDLREGVNDAAKELKEK